MNSSLSPSKAFAALLALSLAAPVSAQTGPAGENFAPSTQATDQTAHSTESPPFHRPFQLRVGKNAHPDDPSADSSQASLRIQREQINTAASQIPPNASPLSPRAGGLIDTRDFQFQTQSTALPGRVTQQGPLRASASIQSLANYDVNLIVDQSLSMRRRDCPGGLSRWQWCGMQLQALSNQLAPYTPQGFTLTTFASEFQVYQNATARDVQQLFAYPHFAFGTRLSRPLNAILDSYFQNRTASSKPLLIVVITDGVPAPPGEPMVVGQSLISATQRLNRPDEVTIVFFQIGGSDRFGRYFLEQMDNALVAHGARYDIVRTVSFEQLQEQGLSQSLVYAVKNFAYQAAR